MAWAVVKVALREVFGGYDLLEDCFPCLMVIEAAGSTANRLPPPLDIPGGVGAVMAGMLARKA